MQEMFLIIQYKFFVLLELSYIDQFLFLTCGRIYGT